MTHENCILSIEAEILLIDKELSEYDEIYHTTKYRKLLRLKREFQSAIRILKLFDEIKFE